MLELITYNYYHNKVFTTDFKLFCKLYKWNIGLYSLLALRKKICAFVFGMIGIALLIFIKPILYGLVFIDLSLLFINIHIREITKAIKFNKAGLKTPAQKRAYQIEGFIRRFISINGKALGPKEWKAIREYDIDLYNNLLSNECNHCCYYYSLEIARIIRDSTLMWGAVEEPFKDGHKYYAHAVILRNGYIYDSNMRQSIKYEDFAKFYKFKLYKQCNYDEYSQEDFRKLQRAEFRKWCEDNNVLDYEKF